MDILRVSVREENGKYILDLKGQNQGKNGKQPAEKSPQMTEKEIQDKTLEKKAEYQQMKTMLTAFLSEVKVDKEVVLPGEIEQATNMKRVGKTRCDCHFRAVSSFP